MTSAPRGIVNANVLSASPTFSLKFVKENVEVVPCLSAAVSALDLVGGPIDDQQEPVVVALRQLRLELQSVAAGRRAGESRLTVKSRVRLPLPDEEQHRRRRLVVGGHRD